MNTAQVKASPWTSFTATFTEERGIWTASWVQNGKQVQTSVSTPDGFDGAVAHASGVARHILDGGLSGFVSQRVI